MLRMLLPPSSRNHIEREATLGDNAGPREPLAKYIAAAEACSWLDAFFKVSIKNIHLKSNSLIKDVNIFELRAKYFTLSNDLCLEKKSFLTFKS